MKAVAHIIARDQQVQAVVEGAMAELSLPVMRSVLFRPHDQAQYVRNALRLGGFKIVRDVTVTRKVVP